MHTIIFANGLITETPLPLPDHDLLVAADGGARNAARFALQPDVLIGDFDSLSNDEVARLKASGARLIRRPAEKDETDLELALDYSTAAGADAVTLYGLFGGRWDMTFANLQLLANPKFSGVHLKIVEGDSQMHILRGGKVLQIDGAPGDTVSVIPLGGPAEGVSYKGLTWPLENETLPFSSPRGVSNTMKDAQADIALRKGIVLVVHAPPEFKEER